MTREKNIDFWDEKVTSEGDYPYWTPKLNKAVAHQLNRVVETIFKAFSKIPNKKKKTLLDAGSGTGVDTIKYSKLFKKVVGVDAAPNAIKTAKKRYKSKKCVFKVADVTKLPFKDKEFDVSLLSGVIHHLYKPEKCLKELKRVTKDDIVIVEPNGLNFIRKLKEIFVYEDKREERSYTSSQLKKLFAKSGLDKNVEFTYINFIPLETPNFLLPIMKVIEKVLEKTPLKYMAGGMVISIRIS
jgi:ubiquinone/menaquinone biosynthesis C-methylase UbiE